MYLADQPSVPQRASRFHVNISTESGTARGAVLPFSTVWVFESLLTNLLIKKVVHPAGLFYQLSQKRDNRIHGRKELPSNLGNRYLINVPDQPILLHSISIPVGDGVVANI